MTARAPAREPLVELDRARLLEHVDHRVRVGPSASEAPASASARAGPIPSARSRSVVGQRQQQQPAPPSVGDVRVGEVGGVDRRERGPERAGLARAPPSGCARTPRRQASFSAGCSETCACSGRSRSAAQAATVPHGAGSTARTLWIAAPIRPRRRRRAPRRARPRPRRRRRRSARWTSFGGSPMPAVQVAGVEQGDPDPGLARGGDQRRADLVRIVVGLAAGRVVEVVELADRGDPGERHLGEGRPGEAEVALGVEPRRERVHLLAPGPEAPAPALRAAAQRAVKGVRVGVGEARAASAREPLAPAGGATPGLDRGDALALDLDHHPRLGPLAAEPGELAPVAAVTSPPARRAPRARSLELLAVEALELLPGGQRPRVGAIDEQDPVEVVDLVLEGARR